MNSTQSTVGSGRRRHPRRGRPGRRRGPATWALAVAAVGALASGCASPLRDLGPLPPRYTGPVLPADAVVADLTAALAAEGVAVRRMPVDPSGAECHEALGAEHPPVAAEAAVRAAFDRARSAYGWQPATGPGEEYLSVGKGNWTATTRIDTRPSAGAPAAPVVISLVCDGRRATPPAPAGSPGPG
ncbi:hypothetical protein ACGFXC_04145 [Streptomyces sp. NPDC048507]|uniref:hypothetical protein n=1 Tax=Streptomyces sp. NPDC048507 TaxID=3365560 RepID=UPI003711E296